jgi:hypothetical protein
VVHEAEQHEADEAQDMCLVEELQVRTQHGAWHTSSSSLVIAARYLQGIDQCDAASLE